MARQLFTRHENYDSSIMEHVLLSPGLRDTIQTPHSAEPLKHTITHYRVHYLGTASFYGPYAQTYTLRMLAFETCLGAEVFFGPRHRPPSFTLTCSGPCARGHRGEERSEGQGPKELIGRETRRGAVVLQM